VSRPTLGPTHSLIQWVTGALSPGIKRPRREAIPPLPKYDFMVWCLVKHRYNFTFLISIPWQCDLKYAPDEEGPDSSVWRTVAV